MTNSTKYHRVVVKEESVVEYLIHAETAEAARDLVMECCSRAEIEDLACQKKILTCKWSVI